MLFGFLPGAVIGRGAGLAGARLLASGAEAGFIGVGEGLPAGFAIGVVWGALGGLTASGPLVPVGALWGFAMPRRALNGFLAGFPGWDGLLLSLFIRHTAP